MDPIYGFMIHGAAAKGDPGSSLSGHTMSSLSQYRAEQERERAYNDWYRKQQMSVYGRELPAAEQMVQGANSGDTSFARWHQVSQLGNNMGQMAAAQASNPLAARAAMFTGAQNAGQIAGQGAFARADEVSQARQAQLAAHLRQMQYQRQIDSMMSQKAAGLEDMRRAISAMKQKDEAAAQQMMINAAIGGASAASGAFTGAGMAMGNGGGGPPAGSMGAAGYVDHANAGSVYDANNWATPGYE